MDRLERGIERFRTAGPEMRLQFLLGFAKKMPELPPELEEARDEGLNRVTECQTPLFLWVGSENGTIRIHADAPRESPTVRGFVSFLIDSLQGEPTEAVAQLPENLLERMGLAEVLGVMRTQGLGAVIRRIRKGAEAAGQA